MPSPMHLLLIDPQNDFCDLPVQWCPPAAFRPDFSPDSVVYPALPVKGAHADMLRTASLLRTLADKISGITVTLDTHPAVAIERPAFWKAPYGLPIAPFTTVSAADVESGAIVPIRADRRAATIEYLEALEQQGKYKLMIWPPHCVEGTWGHAVHAAVGEALIAWEHSSQGTVAFTRKGMNPMTEQYSAVRAEVPVAGDEATECNQALLMRLVSHLSEGDGRILVAGEASSHCVRATLEDLLFGHYAIPGLAERLVILSDCMSPVAGFQAQGAAFFDRMRDIGARIATSNEVAFWAS
jgi:nicotinamidase/pyrazinamidase